MKNLCLLCKAQGQKQLPLCIPCQQELPWHPLDTIGFQYLPPIDHWISQLKFHQRLDYAKLLGRLFADKLKNRPHLLPDLIIPIPLSTRRLCYRGFNQVLEIAKPLSRELNIPIYHQCLQRIRHTKPQSELSKKEREENLKNAFRLTRHTQFIAKRRVALLDDVITTGATIKAAYKILRQGGITQIVIWSCAKTQWNNRQMGPREPTTLRYSASGLWGQATE